MIRTVLLVLFCTTRPCGAKFPDLLWSRTLPNGGTIVGDGLRKGNGIVLSGDEESLWISDEMGALHVYDIDGNEMSTFQPDGLADRSTESRSSVSLYQPDGSIAFAVYAVIDVPYDHGPSAMTNTNTTTSRVIALNGGNNVGTLRWATTIQGVVEGTPMISTDAAKVYLTHNTRDYAHFTVLESNSGTIVSQTVDPRPMSKYGALSFVTLNGVDQLYWADANEDGYAVGGRVHTVLSTNFTNIHGQRSFASSTTLPPKLSKDGKHIWFGGRDSTVHGWGENTLKPVWSTQLKKSLRNESYPIVNRIETDYVEQRLFVLSASNSLHCIDAQSGSVVWSTDTSASIFLTGAKYSYADNVVYTIENEICQASVEADFSLSSDGTTLYYGDIYGRINALKVADPFAPSSSPSQAPSNMPSLEPSSVPSLAPSSIPSTQPSFMPSSPPSTSLAPSTSAMPSSTAFSSMAPSHMPSTTTSQDASTSPSTVPWEIPSEKPIVGSQPTPEMEPRERSDPPAGPDTAPPSAPPTPEQLPATSSANTRRHWATSLACACLAMIVL